MATPNTQQKAAAPPPPKPSRLASVVRGKIERPMRVLVYGTEGIGKSTFAANAPSPVFLDTEDGTGELDASRIQIASWRDALETIQDLTTEEHGYKTVVLDTLDALEQMCWKHLCETRLDDRGKPRDGIEAFGYGKGYVAALEEWRDLVARLERLRSAKNVHIVFVAHSWVKPFKNPEAEDFDRYEMKLHAKAAGLLKGWCDTVLFAKYETFTHTDDNKRVRGIASGARVVHTTRTAAFDAKNRYDLPDTLPLDWSAFAEAVAAHRPADPAKLRERIAGMLESASDDVRKRVTAALEMVGDDVAELARITDKLAATTNINATENEQ